MTEPHHHSSRHHRSRSSKTHGGTRSAFKKAEKFITQYFFRILGIAFFIAGAVILIQMISPGQSLLSKILSFFTFAGPEGTVDATIFSFNGWKFLIQLLPGFIILALPFFLYNQNPAFARVSALAGSFWVFAVHIKILLSYWFFIDAATLYPTLWTAMTVTLALCILPLWHAYKLRQGSLHLLVIILFYISLLFLVTIYHWHYYPDFLFLLLFTGLVLLLCYKTGKLLPFYLHSFLSILLIAIFWLRRILIMDSVDLVSTYIIISSLFYITFFISGLVINLSRKKVIHELVAILLMLVNTLFYWGSVLYVLQKYGYEDLEGLFTMILALFTGTLLYFSPKLNPNLFRNPYVFLTLFLFSMIFPLWAHQNYVILFTSVFSVLMVLYSKYAKSRSAFVASIGLVAIMSVTFIYKWIILYFPGIYAGAFPLDRTLFYDGFQSGVFTLFALFFNHMMIKKLETPIPGKWFSRRRYRMILNIFFIVLLYISGFWCWHFLFSMLFPVQEAMLLSWFSFTCLFLIILIPILEKQKSSLLRPVFVVAALALPAYPLLVNSSIVAIRNMGLQSDYVYISCFIAHYFLLPLFLGLIALFYYYLRQSWINRRFMMLALHTYAIGLCLSLVLMEYDHSTVFFGYTGKVKISEMVSQNHHLPWSIILLIVSLLLIGFGVIRNHRFIPRLSVLLLLATLAKILVFDFAFLGDLGRIIVLFILGGFLIAFSFFYQRFRKAVIERKVRKPAEDSHG
jgi:hypothetical protein